MSTRHEINLLPLGFRQRVAVNRILWRWAWVATGVAALCAIHVATLFTQHGRRQADVVALRQASQPVLAAMEHRDAMQQRNRELTELHARIEGLMPSDDLLQTLGAVALATVDPAAHDVAGAIGPRMQSLQIDLTGAHSPQSAAGDAATSPDTHVTLTAVARDDATLNQLITRLRLSGRFRDVRLRGTAQHDVGGGRKAEVEAEVLVEKELPQ